MRSRTTIERAAVPALLLALSLATTAAAGPPRGRVAVEPLAPNLGGTTASPTACDGVNFVYVAQWSPPRITIFCVEPDGGLLLQGSIATAGDARDMLVVGQILYYAHIDIDQYVIGPDGSLALAGTLPFGNGSFDDLAIDPVRNTLYGTHSSGVLYVLDLPPESGVLTTPIQALPGFYTPHGVTIGPDGTAGFVANQWSFIGDPETQEEIVGFVLNADGTFNPAQTSHSTFGARPDYMVFHPTLLPPRIYYTDRPGAALNTVELSMGQYNLLSSQFSGFGASRLVMNAAGTRIYVANRDDSNISVFAVDGAGDTMLLLQVPTCVRPADLVLRPDEDFLYVVCEGFYGLGSELRVYTVATEAGELTAADDEDIDPFGQRVAAVAIP